MNVSLTNQLETYVQQKVATGMYNSASEVIREALRLMAEKDSEQALKVLFCKVSLVWTRGRSEYLTLSRLKPERAWRSKDNFGNAINRTGSGTGFGGYLAVYRRRLSS